MIIDTSTYKPKKETKETNHQNEKVSTTTIIHHEYPDEIKIIADNIQDIKYVSENINEIATKFYQIKNLVEGLDLKALKKVPAFFKTKEFKKLAEDIVSLKNDLINTSRMTEEIAYINKEADKLTNIFELKYEIKNLSKSLDKITSIINMAESINKILVIQNEIKELDKNIQTLNFLNTHMKYIISLIELLKEEKLHLQRTNTEKYQYIKIQRKIYENIEKLGKIYDNINGLLALSSYLEQHPNILETINKQISVFDQKTKSTSSMLDTKINSYEKRVKGLIDNFIISNRRK